METFLRDLRYAVRQLTLRPGFTASVVLTLVLGVGFVTTLFTMINGIAYSKLPFPESHRIVTATIDTSRYDEFARLQRGMKSFAFFRPFQANVRAQGFASRESAATVSSTFFDVLPVQAAVGRTFSSQDGLADAERTAVIGHRFWEREFEGSPEAVGKVLMVNGEAHTVIGVMPRGFAFPLRQSIWVVRRASETVADGVAFGRLSETSSAGEVSAQLTAIASASAAPVTTAKEPIAKIQVQPFTEAMVKDAIRIMLTAILGATFLVLLLACANVTNLVLARAADRRKELAIRAALGAGRGRLIRQMLTENLVLIVLGTLGGLAVAWASTRIIWNYMIRESELTGGVPYWMSFGVDVRVLVFVVAVAAMCSLITGLLPALQISRIDLNEALKAGSRGSLRLSRLTRLLVNAQMAFSVALVTVAAFFLAILHAYSVKELPYEPTRVLTAQISLEDSNYDADASRSQFFAGLLARASRSGSVDAVGLNSSESLRSSPLRSIELEGKSYQRDRDRPIATFETISDGFLDVVNSHVLRGRNFSSIDTATSMPVALVNSEFVARYGNGEELLGRRIRIPQAGTERSSWMTIVGIAPEVGSMKAGRKTAGPVVYRPLSQVPERIMTLLVRSSGDAKQLKGAIRREVAALDPELPVSRIKTVAEILELERIGMNAFGSLFVLCGIGALALAAVGIYGVIAFSVRMRVREFGIRLALGATPMGILRFVMKEGLKQVATGLGAGVLLAAMASIILGSAIEGFSQSPGHAWIYAGVVLLLSSVGAVALAIPALRASRVDPMVALRTE